MRAPSPLILALIVTPLLLISFVVWPQLDLIVSGWFYTPEHGFAWQYAPPLLALNQLAYYGSRILGVGFAVAALTAFLRRKFLFALPAKAWLFLLACLLIGPGLVANVIFKDHWGRARPREITQFGGASPFSPPLVPSQACTRNCSFVSGDGAFGFFLPSFAYVAAPRRRRRVFWSCTILGTLFSTARIVMGAHFLSDVLFAATFMLLTSAALHSQFYGWKQTRECWKNGWRGATFRP